MGFDRVDAVTIGTDGRLPISFCDRGSVDALLEFFGNGVVAMAAGEWHIKFEDRRF